VRAPKSEKRRRDAYLIPVTAVAAALLMPIGGFRPTFPVMAMRFIDRALYLPKEWTDDPDRLQHIRACRHGLCDQNQSLRRE